MNKFFKKKSNILLGILISALIFVMFPIFYEEAKKVRRNLIFNSKNVLELDLALSVKRSLSFEKNIKVSKKNDNFYLEDNSKEYAVNYLKSVNEFKKHKNFSENLFIKDFEIEIPGKNGMIQAKPQICGEYLYYTTKYGYLGKVDLKLKKTLWFKKITDSFVFANKNFTCHFVDKIQKEILFIPSQKGIFCLNPDNGNLEKKICNNGKIPSKNSLVEPVFYQNNIYVATSTPSGIESYNYITGEFLWRIDLEWKLLGGSNPWSGVIFDKVYKNIIINTGSPSYWPGYNLEKNYQFANSTIAIDAFSGKINWYFQEVKKDFWDHDLVGTPILLEKKIDNNHVVISLSKSGNIFFINRKNGKIISDIKNSEFTFGKVNFNVKNSSKPPKLLNTDFYNSKDYQFTNVIYKDKKAKNEKNRFYYGHFPPILKKTRIFDGYSGGPQWYGAAYDKKNDLLIVPYNKNQIVKHYYDFELKEKKLKEFKKDILEKNNCLSCHSAKGKVINKNDFIVPSLFLVSKIYSENQFNDFLKNDYLHNNLGVRERNEVKNIYKTLSSIDRKTLNSKNYKKYEKFEFINFYNEKNISKLNSFGYIAAVSSKDLELKWIVPAGSYFSQKNKKIQGSPNWGGVAVHDDLVIFNGSFDKMVYAMDIFNGEKLWEYNLPASASSPPQISEYNNDIYMFINATGGRVDKGNKIIVFKKRKK